ncbi:Hpt domain-containing protein [Arthrobacter sp. LAPM80]|uniref:Hpt domain-containing protein n=1 Tax=Arthrobacter sp. LAPM80 TaxID=3141788 RepID=UPI00398B8C98
MEAAVNHNKFPLVDLAALQALEDSLQGQKTLSANFVCSFVQMWPQRIERLTQDVSHGDWANAADAALSIHSSSSMAGSPRLSALSAEIAHLLTIGHYLKAASMLEELNHCGKQTMDQLSLSYLRQD